MENWIIFGILSVGIIFISWRTLLNIRSHGFYRFFGWELLLWLLVNNFKFWFSNPLSINQLMSWTLLLFSLYLLIAGILLMKEVGKPANTRESKNLYQFEKTSRLIDSGVFRYIRHPLYASLIYLTWGIFLKNPTIILLFVALLASIFFYLTMLFDEKECIEYFGDEYREYMKCSKMFIPFIF